MERPWILVQRLDGEVEEVSLLDLFTRAHELRGVVGELPTQAFAMVRLLLAVLHRAVEGPADTAAWQELWRRQTLPVVEVRDYLDRHRARFDLWHPVTPFFQVADLRTKSGEVFGLERLIADVPNGAQFFTTRAGAGLRAISWSEAARWLVHCMAYDPSGIKSGAVGDDRVKGGKGYPIGIGWAGWLGGVFVEGVTLRETLLLNLIASDSNQLDPEEGDLPAWERAPLTASVEDRLDDRPLGPLELYTWQSRRIRLFGDISHCTGVLIANGDPCPSQNMHRQEPMAGWRRSEAQSKRRGGGTVFMPRAHQPGTALWRGLPALLPSAVHYAHTAAGPSGLAPAVLHWVGELQRARLLPADQPIRTRAVAVTYGSQQSAYADVYDDALALAVALLREDSIYLGETVDGAVRDAKNGAEALGQLAANLVAAAGGDGGQARPAAQELAYTELDQSFRSWIAALDADTSSTDGRMKWQRIARDVLFVLGTEMVERAGPVAWAGRDVNSRHMSTPEAEAIFRAQLRKTFAYDTEEVSG